MIDEHKTEVETLRAQLMEWKQGVAPESAFWDRWMQQRGGECPEDFQKRFDPNTALDPWVGAAARGLSKKEVSILDVGSGPVPSIGYKLDGIRLKIIAVDPLASIYNSLLARYGLRPPVAPTFAPAEELSSFFDLNSFDIVHCRNALDHSFDPVRGIREMLKVVHVGGVILLRHHRNEAEYESYSGFHHFNFDCRDGRFVIWNRSITVDLAGSLDGQVQISCETKEFVETVIGKIKDAPEPTQSHRNRMRQYLEAFVGAVSG